MAALASVTETEVTGLPGVQIVKGTATATGDTYTSRFRLVTNAFVNDQTTKGGASVTYATGVVIVNCTNGDVVDLMIFGKD